jgi:hypothetical protein
MAQHEAAAAAYWAAVRRHDGGSATTRTRPGLTTNQHILHLLISVFTFGLWLPVWFVLANRSVRTTTAAAADPSAPMPEWPPPDPSAWGRP